jgi:hypothetical protein
MSNIGDPRNLEGWELYPENLPSSGCNAYGYDCTKYNQQLSDDSERLFSEKLYVKAVEFGPSGKSEVFYDCM